MEQKAVGLDMSKWSAYIRSASYQECLEKRALLVKEMEARERQLVAERIQHQLKIQMLDERRKELQDVGQPA
jgi:CRISPR/Cas system-associated protein Csx1